MKRESWVGGKAVRVDGSTSANVAGVLARTPNQLVPRLQIR